jgi:hypothetical protein
LANAAQESLEASCIIRRLGIKDCRDISQTVERALDDLGRPTVGKCNVLAQSFLNGGSSFTRFEISYGFLDEIVRGRVKFRCG